MFWESQNKRRAKKRGNYIFSTSKAGDNLKHHPYVRLFVHVRGQNLVIHSVCSFCVELNILLSPRLQTWSATYWCHITTAGTTVSWFIMETHYSLFWVLVVLLQSLFSTSFYSKSCNCNRIICALYDSINVIFQLRISAQNASFLERCVISCTY